MFVFQVMQLPQKKQDEVFSGVLHLQGQSAQKVAQMLRENYAVMHAAMNSQG